MQFSRFRRRHRVPVFGLYPDHENRIEFKLRTAGGETHRRGRSIRTSALPDVHPEVEIRRQLPDRIAPGMICMHLGHYHEDGDFQALPSAIDSYRRVRWFYHGDIGHVLKRLENGHLLIQDTRGEDIGRMAEIDLLGRRIVERAEVQTGIHHDACVMPNGNRLLTFGGITRSLDGRPMEIFDFEQDKVNRMKISARIIEVATDLPAREVLHISLADPAPDSYRGYRCYRSVKMPLDP